jgi:hypothetical protein
MRLTSSTLVALLTLTTAAGAIEVEMEGDIATYACAVTRPTPGDMVFITISWDAFDLPRSDNPDKIRVRHVDAKGNVYDGDEQYVDRRALAKRGQVTWTGVWLRDPTVRMVGTLTFPEERGIGTYVERSPPGETHAACQLLEGVRPSQPSVRRRR